MTWRSSLHGCDRVRLNLWDIIKLLLGLEIRDGACKVSLLRWGKEV